MAYIIYNSDGSVLTTLSEGEVDTLSTSLTLLGKNVNNYGQYLNNNLVRLLTNSASPSSPVSPQIGQLWFNKTTKKLMVYDGISFKAAGGATVSGTQPISTSTGELWFDSINNQLKVWNGLSFKLVGPAVSSTYGRFGIEPPTTATIKESTTNIPKDVGIFYSYGEPVAFATTETFTMNTASSITFLGTGTATSVVNGITVLQDLDVRGDLYINGTFQVPSIVTLTTQYDMSFWGDPLSTSTDILIPGNNFLRLDLLPKLFSTVTNSYEVGYPLNSIARVLVVSTYTSATTVRVFRLESTSSGISMWQPLEVYPHPLGGYSNIIFNAD